MPWLSSRNERGINEGLNDMATLLIKCPKTARAVPIGFEDSKESFAASPNQSGSYHCPACGELHRWLKRDLWLEESSPVPPHPLERRRVPRSYCYKCGGELPVGLVPRNLPPGTRYGTSPLRPDQQCMCDPIGGVAAWLGPIARP